MTERGERRVAVRGHGIASPLGLSAEALWEAMASGRNAARPSPPSTRGIPIPPWAATLGEHAREIEAFVQPRYLRRLSTISKSCLAAAVLADRRQLAGAAASPHGDATAVVLGTSFGASGYHFEYYEKLFRNGLKDASPLLFSESVMNAPSGHVAIYLKLRGASLSLVGGEEVGLTAIIDALDRLQLGEAEAAFAGGAEEYCDFVHSAVASQGIIGSEAGEPYSGLGKGTFLSEGACFLRLEDDSEHGSGKVHLVSGASFRSLEGEAGVSSAVESAVLEALGRASLDATAIGLVVTSACGGPLDRPEGEGISRALTSSRRDRAGVLLCAPKAILGEGFAFTSAAQAAVAVEALARGEAPPSLVPLETPRLPEGLRVSSSRAPLEGSSVLVVSTSRRGSAVAAIFSRSMR